VQVFGRRNASAIDVLGSRRAPSWWGLMLGMSSTFGRGASSTCGVPRPIKTAKAARSAFRTAGPAGAPSTTSTTLPSGWSFSTQSPLLSAPISRIRTGIINQIRAFLLERGVPVRQGLRFLRAELPRILATPPDVLSPRMLRVIEDLAGDWRRLDERIDSLSGEIEAIARQDAGCERLMSVPGIGPIISSAMVAAIGTGEAFSRGRDFAAWLGLVPKSLARRGAPPAVTPEPEVKLKPYCFANLHVRPCFDATRPGRPLRSKLLEPHAAVKSP
jgi:hypothetical protein